MRQALILADETATSPRIRERIEQLLLTDPDTRFRLVVPVPQEGDRSEELARQRLERGLAALEGVAADVTGTVGDSHLVRAIAQEMERERVDLILLSAPPSGASRWLRLDLPHRLRRKFDIRVEHIESDAPTAAEPGVTAPKPAKAGQVSVLLVEDNPEDVELTKVALDRASVASKVRVASNGAAALSYVRDAGIDAFDLIVLDLKMPVLDGLGFLEEVGKELNLDDTMVVILSTSGREEDRTRAHELGAAAYMVKENDFEAFEHAIEGLLVDIAG